ncbi:MAG: glycoside hydrolase family 2 protein, partial [Treponemataceae bacterium]
MIFDLSGQWKLYPKNITDVPASYRSKLKNPVVMDFPGDVHSALIANNIIPDPYYGKNELDIQWVGQIDWVAEKEAFVPKTFLAGKQYIVLEMADTFVEVFINDKSVGACDNMFDLWRFEISSQLASSKNIVKFVFSSAEKKAIEKAKSLPYPIPFSEYPVFSPHRNLVRKTQCHAGWDWGPCIMAFGVYGSLYFEQSAKGFVNYILATTTKVSENEWDLDVSFTYRAVLPAPRTVTITLTGKGIEETTASFKVQLVKGENQFSKKMRIKNPEIWQTADTLEGENELYKLTVTVGSEAKTKKIAFRTLEVISQEDEAGKSLYFKINGRPFFAKGSNWIPCDALPSRQTPEKYESLLRSMVEANMNCVRIWGGGQYEKEIFYELCDRLGILIWHDCMFACSLYPSDKEFLESVRKEIHHQILRLQSHPSIALWCGNNEDLGALTWYPESIKNRDRYLIDYDRLNEGVLAKEIAQLDPSRTWWPSSPSAGPNDFSDNWHSDGRGDMHYWTVWHEGKSFDAYLDIRPRFVSEFGYQSFPSIEGIESYADKSQMNLTSPVMEFHQRNPRGNSIILENFSRYFRFPNSFESMIYLSQVQQALAIKTAVEYWRSLRPHCMGAIIWQLNDVWPVASWSSIEYSGKWKLLHYATKDFYAPFAVFPYKKDGKVHINVVNDCAS